MPDPDRKTISATEAPALFGKSPYVTPFMLFHRFAGNRPIDEKENDRMSWGKRLQPLLLDATAEEMRLEVVPNTQDIYVRRGQLGCTRDAEIIKPDQGPGALETKCVFDYETWMHDMDGGRTLAPHHEIQLQVQMLVGDGKESYKWGMLAVFVCGQMHYFERKPVLDLWKLIETEAAEFFERVKAGLEPDPFGSPKEAPLIQQLYTPDPEQVLDLREHKEAKNLTTLAQLYAKAMGEEGGAKKMKAMCKTRLQSVAKENGKLLLLGGVTVELSQRKIKEHTRKASVSTTMKVHVPQYADEWARLEKSESEYEEEGI